MIFEGDKRFKCSHEDEFMLRTDPENLENLEILGGGLASGTLADRGVFGLDEYMIRKERGGKLSEKGGERIQSALRLIKYLEDNLGKSNTKTFKGQDVTSRKLSSYLALSSLMIGEASEESDLLETIKDKIPEMKVTLNRILEGKDVNLEEVKYIRDILARIGRIYLRSAFNALEREKNNLWVSLE